MRKQIAAANWKMNLTLQQGEELVKEIQSEKVLLSENHTVIFAVPFPYLISVKEIIKETNKYSIAAQNCSNKKNGAFTGEVSVEMLQSVGATHCLVGHSERREYFNENNTLLAEKIGACLQQQLIPIFCCGEALAIRESKGQNKYVQAQLEESLFHLTSDQIKSLIIAYEPIWAIGTGKTASTAQAQEMHNFIRSVISTKYGQEVADTIPILYGGSVKASNAVELFSCPDVDGGLVGGASLNAKEFVDIIKALKK